MWSNWADSAKASMTQALEKTGDAISKAATNAGKKARISNDPETKSIPTEIESTAEASTPFDKPTIAVPQRQHELFSSISQGWSSMMESTKASMKQAEETVEASLRHAEEQVKTHLSKVRTSYYKRDPTLPLDVEALKDAEVVYITDRLITMGHPALASQFNSEISGERKLAAIGHLLDRRHCGRYMVWNLSEVDYDITILNEQVLTFSFPGSPSPPLGLLLKLLVSIESWLKADDRNVAVIHCLTGKGRTSTVLSAFLCWMGQAGFSDIYQALEYIAVCKQIPTDELTIPSQRRYASYFKNMLDGVRPAQPPLMLRRIIMSEAPRYAKGPPRTMAVSDGDGNTSTSKDELLGCVPYLQIFKAGKLLHTVPASLHFQQAPNELPFCQVADGNISFHVNIVLQGDILVRARHLTATRKRVSMFRAAFHTGYAPPNVMRFNKSQLDGACTDDRFVDDFFLDFIFEPVDAEEAGRILKEEQAQADSSNDSTEKETKNKNIAVTAKTDDSMLHRDSRFWDVIATRMKEHAEDNSEREEGTLWGPTVGRRRDFSVNDNCQDIADGQPVVSEKERNALETFSIGGEFDFLPETIDSQPNHSNTISKPQAKQPNPKKDSLMEALMGALGDDPDVSDEDYDYDHEVVVFEREPLEEASVSVVESAFDPAQENAHKTENLESTQSATESVGQKAQLSLGSSADDIEKIMSDATLNLEDDMDALLAEAGGTAGLSDDELLNLDVDDADLDDLESFLSQTNKK